MHVILHVLYTFLPHKSRSHPGPPAGAHWFWCVGDFAPPRNHGEAQHVEKHGETWFVIHSCSFSMVRLGQDDGSRWVTYVLSVILTAETCPGDPNRLEEPERVRLLETAPGSDGSDGSGCIARGARIRWSKDQAGAGTAQYALSVSWCFGKAYRKSMGNGHWFFAAFCPFFPSMKSIETLAMEGLPNGYAGPHQTSGAKHRSQSLPNRKYKAIETQLPSGNLT